MISTRCPRVAELIRFMLDSSDFENSTFWDPDTTSGVGGWGNPNDDHQITDGAFATGFPVSYPSPHRLRRQYTPIDPNSTVPLPETFTPESQLAMVNGFVGDFIGFQAFFQSGSHRSIHRIVTGYVIPLTRCDFAHSRSTPQRSPGHLPFKRSSWLSGWC